MKSAFLIVALAFYGIAYADDVKVVEPIEAVFDSWVSNGVLDGALQATAINDRRFMILDAQGFESSKFGVSKSVLFIHKWGMFSQNTQYLPAMRQVRTDIEKACSDDNGRLAYFEIPVKGVTELKSVKAMIKSLKTESLYGRYVCSSSGVNIFQVDVRPLADGDMNVGGFGNFEWRIYVYLINKKQFEAKSEALAKQEQSAKDYRANLKAGSNVSIRSSDLPDSIVTGLNIPRTSFQSDRQYMLCGMVIDVRPEIVQVQIGKDTVYVNKNKVFPFVKRVGLKGYEFPASHWSEWCFE